MSNTLEPYFLGRAEWLYDALCENGLFSELGMSDIGKEAFLDLVGFVIQWDSQFHSKLGKTLERFKHLMSKRQVIVGSTDSYYTGIMAWRNGATTHDAGSGDGE